MYPIRIDAVYSDNKAEELTKYIVILPDGTMAVEGIKQSELPGIISKLVNLAVSQAAETAYDIGYQSGMDCDDEDSADNYDAVQKDLATISESDISYTGKQ